MKIITDFDGTITTSDSLTTMKIFFKCFPKFREEYIELRNYYTQVEMSSEKKTLMFSRDSFLLLSKYLKENNFNEELLSEFRIRTGFERLSDYGDVIVSSSGVGNIIRSVFDYYGFSNIPQIVSNFYDENKEFNLDELIYPRKKYNEGMLDIIRNQRVILIGNNYGDLNMIPSEMKSDLSVCFTDSADEKYGYFDYLLSEDKSFNDVIRLIKKEVHI